jgi:hypothetical protein
LLFCPRFDGIDNSAEIAALGQVLDPEAVSRDEGASDSELEEKGASRDGPALGPNDASNQLAFTLVSHN